MSALSTVIGRGLLSARAAAGNAGRLYYATDTGWWYRDNGSSWDTNRDGFHGAKTAASANTTLTNASTEYPIAFAGADVHDSDAMHDTVTNNTRITNTLGITGYFNANARTYVADVTSTHVDIKIRKNGAAGTILAQARGHADDHNTIIQATAVGFSLAASDYIEAYVMTDTAGRAADSAVSTLELEFVGV